MDRNNMKKSFFLCVAQFDLDDVKILFYLFLSCFVACCCKVILMMVVMMGGEIMMMVENIKKKFIDIIFVFLIKKSSLKLSSLNFMTK